ncbi:HAD family hydrolase [Dactylosporangium sp. CA-233914]|uniref:HAD family hydrolase n=1 Tax=Dactylosporangium sp. CA-233914 TaxID=3239934 RepID=UPI003D906BEC
MPPGQYRDALVLFDWNGTIVLDRDRARTALNEVLAARSLAVLTADDFSSRFQLPIATMFAELGVTPNGLADAEADWNLAMARTAAPARAGATETLQTLADGAAALGVVSAASAAAVAADLERLGLTGRFHSIDAPAVDKTTALRLRRGQTPRAWYVGDTTYDIRSALAVGYRPVGVAGGYATVAALRAAGAAIIIDDLRELLPLIGSPL